MLNKVLLKNGSATKKNGGANLKCLYFPAIDISSAEKHKHFYG